MTMKVMVKGKLLDFVQIPIILHKNGIMNLFVQKNNKTLAETLESKRYKSLSEEVFQKYSNFLNKKLGVFLNELKEKGDAFYLKFLNDYGDGVFCDFSIPSTLLTKSKGIYCFAVSENIKYFGRSHDPFEKRLNTGYGHLSPKNCYKDGQSTNCRINSLISKYHSELSFFVYPIESDEMIDKLEKLLIEEHQPSWNIQR